MPGAEPPGHHSPRPGSVPSGRPRRGQELTPHSPTPLTAFFMVAAILGGCTTHPSRRGEARRAAKRGKTNKPPDSGETTELGASHPPLLPSKPAGCPQRGHGNAQSSLHAVLGTSRSAARGADEKPRPGPGPGHGAAARGSREMAPGAAGQLPAASPLLEEAFEFKSSRRDFLSNNKYIYIYF